MKKYKLWMLLLINPVVSFSQDLVFDGTLLDSVTIKPEKFARADASKTSQVISLL